MQTETPLPEQAESLRMYLLGRIHGLMMTMAKDHFFPPTVVELVDGNLKIKTRSGTKIEFEVTAKVTDVGT